MYVFKFFLFTLQSLGSGHEEEVAQLKADMIAFEKRLGDKAGIEDAILSNRRQHYETILANDEYHYDTWFDLCRLEEAECDANNASVTSLTKVRECYERAISHVPPLLEKRYWYDMKSTFYNCFIEFMCVP